MPTIKTKIQILNDSNSAFGPGKAQLLLAIAEHGSISVAAKSMSMSYKRAWDLVNAMNESFKEPLVVTKVGGSHGGGAEVSALGLKVLSSYQEALKKSEAFIDVQMSDVIKLLK
jgi:molybdate transport system regulatory protein